MKKKPAKVEEPTAIIRREDYGFVALCPDLDVASQGDTRKQAGANLAGAVGLFLEAASPVEIAARLRSETHVTKLKMFEFDAEETARHAAVSGAVARDLGRLRPNWKN